MNSETVLTERDGPVAIVRLNRPEKHNAMNRELSGALAETFARLEADDGVLAIVLTGAGEKAFCAGADMSEGGQPAAGARRTASGVLDGVAAVAAATKPVIGALNGYTYGGGALLAVSTDIRHASPNCTWRFVGASYGLVVGGRLLAEIVGPAHAKELLFRANVIDAAEAERIGLVNRVVPANELVSAAVEIGKQIAANSPDAVRWAKRVVNAATDPDKAHEVEDESNRVLRGTPDQVARFQAAAQRVTGGR
jgi:enoyl-CoA hydratase/carnithine racemase